MYVLCVPRETDELIIEFIHNTIIFSDRKNQYAIEKISARAYVRIGR